MIYGFRAYPAKSEQDTFWIAENSQLNGCVAQGDTLDQTLDSLAENELEWISTATEQGLVIPTVNVLDFGEEICM